jgi:ElaB/YqjD/DUF883 family membrane-anchored ribosome-binding protein
MPFFHSEWSMDQQQGEAVVSDAAAKVGELTAKTGNMLQDTIDQSKPILRDLKESAEAAMDKAVDLAHKASSAGAQAVEAVQGVARDAAHQASQAATSVYQQGTRAGGSVSRYAAEQPLTALLVAAAIGYGIGYLVHRA